MQGIPSGAVKLEGLRHERPHHRIRFFGLSFATVKISNRRGKRIETLFQTAIESLSRLFAKVPNIISSHYSLDVRRETAAPRIQIETFICKMNFHTRVDHLSQVGPIF